MLQAARDHVARENRAKARAGSHVLGEKEVYEETRTRCVDALWAVGMRAFVYRHAASSNGPT